jgi:hypothetical protein
MSETTQDPVASLRASVEEADGLAGRYRLNPDGWTSRLTLADARALLARLDAAERDSARLTWVLNGPGAHIEIGPPARDYIIQITTRAEIDDAMASARETSVLRETLAVARADMDDKARRDSERYEEEARTFAARLRPLEHLTDARGQPIPGTHNDRDYPSQSDRRDPDHAASCPIRQGFAPCTCDAAWLA